MIRLYLLSLMREGMMASKRVHSKPIGESGPVRVSHSANGQATIEWQKLEYPPEKKGQEQAIANSFIASLNASEDPKWGLTALDENDFDFEMSRGSDKRYLELQEVIIPGKKRGPPYAEGEQTIEPAKFAKTILSGINSKATRYPQAAQPLDLLVYTTHWRFVANTGVLQLVCDSLHKSSHPFNNIYFFNRLNESESQCVNLFPSKELLIGFNRDEAEATAYVNFDPGSGETFKDGDKIGVRFAFSPTATKKLTGARE
jgi:hypothetical protein